MDDGYQYFKKNSPKNLHSAIYSILMNACKMMLTWHYGCSHGGVALKLDCIYGELHFLQLMQLVQ
jgi:hypothetical protein